MALRPPSIDLATATVYVDGHMPATNPAEKIFSYMWESPITESFTGVRAVITGCSHWRVRRITGHLLPASSTSAMYIGVSNADSTAIVESSEMATFLQHAQDWVDVRRSALGQAIRFDRKFTNLPWIQVGTKEVPPAISLCVGWQDASGTTARGYLYGMVEVQMFGTPASAVKAKRSVHKRDVEPKTAEGRPTWVHPSEDLSRVPAHVLIDPCIYVGDRWWYRNKVGEWFQVVNDRAAAELDACLPLTRMTPNQDLLDEWSARRPR